MICLTGRVWTGDDDQPWAEAVLLDGDRIAAVGRRDEILPRARGAHLIEAGEGLIAPGFIDAHLHLIAGGFRLTSLQLRDASDPGEFCARLAAFAATLPSGAWITGGDWDHERWGGALPSRSWIDGVTPHHPVWINRLDGHMALANSAALHRAGVTRDTPEVSGGTIVRDAAGEPTGLLKDMAMDLVQRVVPPATAGDEDRALEAAMRHVASHGVTSVHHMGSIPQAGSWNELAIVRRAHTAGRLRTRVYCAVPLDTWIRLRDLIQSRTLGGDDGRGDAWLRAGVVKGFVDGSLGARTAAFHEPYGDAPDNRGLLVTDPGHLREWIIGADKAGLQCAIHAIGDCAIAMLLDTFEAATSRHGVRDRRFRIEHTQHLDPRDIPRIARLRVIASMQPSHLTEDGRWAEQVIGPARAAMTYACRSLHDAGVRLAFGSDWFVMPPVPIAGLAAAVTRRTSDGRHPGGWIPEQRIALDAALRAYTRDAAYASFEEHVKGQLTPGFLADIVVLDRDPFRMTAAEIDQCRVAMTIVGGEIVHER
jgi:predicted amidohydrolase YtcJ